MLRPLFERRSVTQRWTVVGFAIIDYLILLIRTASTRSLLINDCAAIAT